MRCFFASFLLLLHLFVSTRGSKEKLTTCLGEYTQSIKHRPLAAYVSTLNFHLKNLKTHPESRVMSNAGLLFAVGLGTLGDDSVLRQMVQLNASGVSTTGELMHNCKYTSPDHTTSSHNDHVLSSSNGSLVAVGAHSFQHRENPLAWLHVASTHPTARFLVRDVTDREWYDRQYYYPCSMPPESGLLGAFCTLPWVDLPDAGLVPIPLQNVTFLEAQPIIAAYRKFVGCIVPPERTFTFSLNQTTPEEHWRRLTAFLGIVVPEVKLKHLIEGGTSHSDVSKELYWYTSKAGARRRWYRSPAKVASAPQQPREVFPSVCEEQQSYARPNGTDERLSRCTATYTDQFVAMVGGRFRSTVTEALQNSVIFDRAAPSSEDRLILGVGPGSTGTRSLHFATTMLNITGRHWAVRGRGCSSGRYTAADGIDENMNILRASQDRTPVLWLDTPVSDIWFPLFRMYPKSRIIMTDVRNVSEWRRKRVKDHLFNRTDLVTTRWAGNNIPVPFYLSEGYAMRELQRVLKLVSVSEGDLVRGWEMYREFVRCVVPAKQLLWLDMQNTGEPADFWRKLAAFAGVPVSAAQLRSLAAAGVPRVGETTCVVNHRNCTSFTAPLVLEPSVCEHGVVS